MAGSIQNMAALYNKKSFTYISPKSPAKLMESTSFTIDFKSHKFVHIGINPTDKFNITIQILTSSSHVNITINFLKRMFELLGHIIPLVLDKKYKRIPFLENGEYKLNSMTFKGENVLVIESKFHIGCRVLLNGTDLIKLQNFYCAICETIERKGVYTRDFILKQVKEVGEYLDKKLTQVDSPPKNVDEMRIFIKNVKFDKVITSRLNLANQLKICASTQLAKLWEKRWNKQNSQKVY